MKIQKCLFLVLLLKICFAAHSQTKIEFLDKDKETLTGVKTMVYDTSNAIIFKGYSNKEGVILLQPSVTNDLDKFRLTAQIFGFRSYDTTLFVLPNLTLTLGKSHQEIEEVVLTAQYGEKRKENSIHNITVIDRKKIEAIGAVNLRDVLSNEMGVRLSQDNVLGSGMTLQGISGENVKILIDGVPVVGRLNGNVDLSQINLQNIERIEIVEGPLSVNYGTNALAGVINLISKKGKRKEISGSILSYNESIGHYNVNADFNYSGKCHGMGISGGRNFFDGWSDSHPTFSNPEPIADSTRVVTWNPKEQYFGSFYYQFKKKGWFAKYKLDGFTETILNRGAPRPPFYETAFDDTYYTQRIDNSISVRKLFDKGIVNFIASYNRYDRIKNTYFVDLTNLEQVISGNASDQDTSVFDQWMSRATYSSHFDSSRINFQVGYDLLFESATGIRILDLTQTQTDIAMFATSEIQLTKSLVVLPGLRYAYNTTYETPLLPSLNLKWSLFNAWNIRASYARGFRAPSIKELYFEFVDINHNIIGNTDLQAETSQNYALSLRKKFLFERHSIQSELSGFYNDISNQITLASLENPINYSYVNIGAFESNGVRFKNTFSNKHLQSTFGIGVIGRRNRISDETETNTFLYYPEIQSSNVITFNKTKTTIGLFYKYQGKLPNFALDENGQVFQTITDDYHWMDVSASHKFWQKRIILTLGVKNLVGVTQINSSTTGGAHTAGSNLVSVGSGRTYFMSLKFSLQKSLKSKSK